MKVEFEQLWKYYRHLFPEFSASHLKVYMIVCAEHAKTGEIIVKESGFARSSVYSILKELTAANLLKKTPRRPVLYYADEPLRDYCAHSRRLVSKLSQGKEAFKKAMEKGLAADSAVFLVKKDAAGARVIDAKRRTEISDAQKLQELRKAADEKLAEICANKQRAWQEIAARAK